MYRIISTIFTRKRGGDSCSSAIFVRGCLIFIPLVCSRLRRSLYFFCGVEHALRACPTPQKKFLRSEAARAPGESDTGKIYLVPVDHVGTANAMLRLLPTKNNQEKNVRW